MTLKKIIIAWLTLSIIVGAWSVLTGNDSPEGQFQNKLVELCDEAFEDNEDILKSKFLSFSMNAKFESVKQNQPLMLKVNYDNDIEPIVEAKRGVNRNELNVSCQQTLASNYKDVDPVAVIMVHVNEDGDSTYQIADYDLYDKSSGVWWSSIE